MLRRLLAVAAVLVVAGCSSEPESSAPPPPPPPPKSVAGLDPCTVLTAQELAGLHLTVQDHEQAGARRSCTFFTTDNTIGSLDERRENAIDTLEITIRRSTAPNAAADAKRVAETYQRERQAKLTTTKVAGRDVYQVGPDTALGCPWFFQVDATSSVEVAETVSGGAPQCVNPGLTLLIAGKLPAPDPTPPHPDHDRPATIVGLDPCDLLSKAQRAKLHLDGGELHTDVAPMCFYSTSGNRGSASITFRMHGAEASRDGEKATVKTVHGRTVYEQRDTENSTCDVTIEVTRATSVWLSGTTVGSVDKACQFTARLGEAIEPALPLVVS